VGLHVSFQCPQSGGKLKRGSHLPLPFHCLMLRL
jgi:hypothetical protein